jgi:hypothetical protein
MVGIILAIIIGVSVWLLLRKKSSVDAIPGPRAYPLVGNALQLNIEKLFLQLTSLSKEYGGVMRLYLFSEPVVVVSDAELIHEVLVTRVQCLLAGRIPSQTS